MKFRRRHTGDKIFGQTYTLIPAEKKYSFQAYVATFAVIEVRLLGIWIPIRHYFIKTKL